MPSTTSLRLGTSDRFRFVGDGRGVGIDDEGVGGDGLICFDGDADETVDCYGNDGGRC